MAAAEQALGLWLDAEAHYLKALGAPADSYIKSHRQLLELGLAEVRQHLGDLEVLGPAGATLWISGRQVTMLPMSRPLRLVIGSVLFEVRATCCYAMSRQAQILPSRLSRETVNLLPITVPSRLRLRKILGFAAAGLGLAALGGGIAGWVFRERYIGEWNDDSVCLNNAGSTREQLCQERRLAAERAQVLAVAGFIVSGVFIGGAVALLIPAWRESGRLAHARFLPGPGQFGLALDLNF